MLRFPAGGRIGVLFLASLAVAAILAAPSGATVIRGGDGTGNTLAPLDDPGWGNVGRLNGGSAVYLGDRWVLTAAHVSQGAVNFDGTSYAMESGSWHQLQQPGSPGTLADLALMRLETTPAGVVDLAINASPLPHHAEVVGIGYGRNRAESTTFWDDQWNVVSPPGEYGGFETLGSTAKRWGRNHIDGTDLIAINGSSLETHGLVMDFDEEGGAGDDEMQVVPGDSGGGIFYNRGGTWELAGIIVAQGIFDEQPSGLAVFGNQSLAADLSQYRAQIMGIVPEPSAWVMLLGLGASCVVCCVWRRARSRVAR